ncbi:MAG: tRNA (adenosine(37)-N6)-threonylcarbamoyltransferase complex ATPase subunit type 1 TsaE [Bdellovibrionales bacterium]|nr:tRNA (adenosine(37)-N6)-threonylcarbamoyltransferase complex ATPase subunit type 1 TsaE [Bdellovibrionales bacterium]
MIFKCNSLKETQALGQRLGKLLIPGDVVALHGDLGSGKTSLVQGVVQGLGLSKDEIVNSPTFIIANFYPTRTPVCHVDFYRIQNLQEFDHLGILDLLGDTHIFLIEWFEKFPSVWTGDTIHLYFELESETMRRIEIKATERRSSEILSLLGQAEP